MRLKKLANMAMAGVMTVSLVACGGSDTVKTTAADVATTVEAETIAAAGDTETRETGAPEAPVAGDIAKEDLKTGFVYIGDENEGYTAARHNGVMEMKEKLGLNGDQTIIRWSTLKDETAKDATMGLTDQGCQIVLIDSSGRESYVIETAEERPDVQFCHATSFQAVLSGLNNMHNYFTSICESRHISGIVTGLKLNQMIEDGTVKVDACEIDYVDAYPYAEVVSGYTSFFLGVHPVCLDATMEVKYANDWASFDLKKEATGALIFDRCVLISQHVDITGVPTIYEAAGTPCVGYNISMIATAPEQTLISASNNWAVYATEVVQYVIGGIEIPVDQCKGFSDGAVLIIELNEVAVALGIKEKMDGVEARLASGELHVFGTSIWTASGEILDTYKKDGSDTGYISDGYFHEPESSPTPAFGILVDGVIIVDN